MLPYGSAETLRHGGSKPPPYGSAEILRRGGSKPPPYGSAEPFATVTASHRPTGLSVNGSSPYTVTKIL